MSGWLIIANTGVGEGICECYVLLSQQLGPEIPQDCNSDLEINQVTVQNMNEWMKIHKLRLTISTQNKCSQHQVPPQAKIQ